MNSLVTILINKLDKIFLNVDRSQVHIDLAIGKVSLENLQIRPFLFADKSIPIDCESGSVGSINIDTSIIGMLFKKKRKLLTIENINFVLMLF